MEISGRRPRFLRSLDPNTPRRRCGGACAACCADPIPAGRPPCLPT